MVGSDKCQQVYGKYVKQEELEQGEPIESAESISTPSEDVSSQQSEILPSATAAGSMNSESPQEIENREAAYFKHMHLTFLDQPDGTEVQSRIKTQESTSNEPEFNSNAAQDFEYTADPEFQKGSDALESGSGEGLMTLKTQANVELLGNGALVNGPPEEVQIAMANEDQAQGAKRQKQSQIDALTALDMPPSVLLDVSGGSRVRSDYEALYKSEKLWLYPQPKFY